MSQKDDPKNNKPEAEILTADKSDKKNNPAKDTKKAEQAVTIEGESKEIKDAAKKPAKEAADKPEQPPVKQKAPEQKQKPEPTKKEPKAKGSKLAVLAFLMSLIALACVTAGAYWLYMQEQQKAAWQQQLGNAVSSQSGQQQNIAQLQTQVKSLLLVPQAQQQISSKLNADVQALTDADASQVATMDILKAELGNLHNKLGSSRRAWIESEVEYLLRYANERLQLFRDHKGAIAALSSADARILDLGDPAFFDVRKVINSELAALRTARVPDVSGASLRLLGLSEQVSKLKLPNTKPNQFVADEAKAIEADEEMPGWKASLLGLWEELKSLVTIRSDDSAYEPMLAPEARTFVYQNLQMQIESARLSLLLGDVENYQRSLKKANDWLTEWFDTSDAGVNGMQAQLNELAAVSMETDIPNISNSLQTMLQAIKRRDGEVIEQSSSVIEQPVTEAVPAEAAL